MGQSRQRNVLGVERIFNLLDQGYSPAEINGISDGKRAREAESRRKGADSELNALRALNNLPYVKKVRQISNDANHDYLSHDLSILLDAISCIQILDSGLAIPHNRLFAQVVSSQGGVDHFRKMTLKRLNKSTEYDFNRYMVREKLVLLNGQLSDDEIQTEFQSQLVRLNLAWALGR